MALTQEQLDTLEKGTPIVIHTTFDHFDCDGDVRYKAPYSVAEDHYCYIDPKFVSLPGETVEQPKPKYDPCRKFREGDRVKPRSVFGRKLYIKDVLYEVMWDESCNKMSVKDLTSAETLVGMPSVFFELVTPVEELEPYYVEEQDSCYVVGKRQESPEMEYIAGFSKTRHPNAKAAAEAECKRLNDEWKQSHQN